MYSPILHKIDDLFRKSLEHGFIRFYDRFASFSTELRDKSSLSFKDQQLQSQAITVENIWVYVYIFLGANCINTVIFLCEIFIFYRKRILSAFFQGVEKTRRVAISCCKYFSTKIRVFLRVVIRSARRLVFRRI